MQLRGFLVWEWENCIIFTSTILALSEALSGKLAAFVALLAHKSLLWWLKYRWFFYESKLIQRELLKTRELTQHCTLQDVLAKLTKPNGVKYQMQYVEWRNSVMMFKAHNNKLKLINKCWNQRNFNSTFPLIHAQPTIVIWIHTVMQLQLWFFNEKLERLSQCWKSSSRLVSWPFFHPPMTSSTINIFFYKNTKAWYKNCHFQTVKHLAPCGRLLFIHSKQRKIDFYTVGDDVSVGLLFYKFNNY